MMIIKIQYYSKERRQLKHKWKTCVKASSIKATKKKIKQTLNFLLFLTNIESLKRPRQLPVSPLCFYTFNPYINCLH